ncbi:MAG: hypothetical protein HZA88_10465 [Verrucomicrobia bacterium]|nr:hypothetical protein [Verrucomicrobiota bacterium]
MPRKTKKPVSYAQQPERIGVPTTGNPLDGLVVRDPELTAEAQSSQRTEKEHSPSSAPSASPRCDTVLSPVFRDDAHGIFLYHGRGRQMRPNIR